MHRRDFLKTSFVGAVAGLSAGGIKAMAADAPPAPAKPAVLKLCSQEGKIPGKSLKEKAETILKFGGCGLEFGGMSAERAKQIKQDLAGTGVGVAALCWGRFSLMDSDAEKRKKAVEDLKHAVEVAAEVGSTGVIVVPPSTTIRNWSSTRPRRSFSATCARSASTPSRSATGSCWNP